MSFFDHLKDEDFKQMQHVQGEVVKALLPFADNTEAALAVMALARCARTLIRKYGEKGAQRELEKLVCSFIMGETENKAMAKHGAGRLLIMPPTLQ